MRKRITALLLAFVMTASLLPVTAQAVSPEAEAQAAVITTAAEFAAPDREPPRGGTVAGIPAR